MASQTIISLAILKVNWDRLKKDYLENFVPFVAECIRLSEDDIVALPPLQEQLQARFGLRFPQSALKTILGRLHKRGYVRSENKMYRRSLTELEKLDFQHVQGQVLRNHEALVNSAVAFCREQFGVVLKADEAENALQSYLEENQLLIAGAAEQGTLIPPIAHPAKSGRFLLGAFVQHIQQEHPTEFEYLETIVKGNMLANAIFLPEPTQAQRRFRKTEIYFDTSFLVFALGYGGKPRQDPCVELLALLYETGADLRCFRHTYDEVKGTLEACASRIERDELRDAYGPSIDYFLSKGYTGSDIRLLVVKLENDLAASRIKIVDKPPYEREHVIDEKSLEGEIVKEIQYAHPKALVRDVDSIAAIMRLRRGRENFAIEDCRALFVTTNAALTRISRQFFYRDASPGAVPPCLPDYTLTNLLWLKKPLTAPDLPKKRIIADCYAATQPDTRLWKRYLAEIDKLEKSKNLTADDYYLLRHSIEAKSALMDLTRGEEDAFTAGTVPEILDLVHSRVKADLRSKLESESMARRDAEAKVLSAKAREEDRVLRINLRAQRFASVITKLLKPLLFILLSIGTISTFPWKLPSITLAPVRYVICAIQAVLLVLSVLNLMYGTALEAQLRKLELSLSRFVKNMLVALTE